MWASEASGGVGVGEQSERRGVWAGEASGGGVTASEASFPPEASQVVAEGDGLRVGQYDCAGNLLSG